MNRLKEVRKGYGLTLKQLSMAFRERGLLIVKAGKLSKYERGEREPSVEVLEAYSFYFKTSIDYLLGVDRTQCTEKTDDESDSEYLTDLYDLKYCQYCGEVFKYCPYCGRKL
nr:MAG TPA: helix-turn-helix domain protein [Caudoviricetes sp.]